MMMMKGDGSVAVCKEVARDRKRMESAVGGIGSVLVKGGGGDDGGRGGWERRCLKKPKTRKKDGFPRIFNV